MLLQQFEQLKEADQSTLLLKWPSASGQLLPVFEQMWGQSVKLLSGSSQAGAFQATVRAIQWGPSDHSHCV